MNVLVTALMQFAIGIDRAIFHAFNSLAGKCALTDWLGRVGADDHIIPIALVLLLLLLFFIAKNSREREVAFSCIICALIATVISTIIIFGLNSLFFRPKPFTSQHVHLLFYLNTDSAFPSNATALAFSLGFSTFLFNRKVGCVMLALGVYVGIARVFVGVHYPLDVIAGLIIGLASAFLAKCLEPAYRPLSLRLNSALCRLLSVWVPPRTEGKELHR